MSVPEEGEEEAKFAEIRIASRTCREAAMDLTADEDEEVEEFLRLIGETIARVSEQLQILSYVIALLFCIGIGGDNNAKWKKKLANH